MEELSVLYFQALTQVVFIFPFVVMILDQQPFPHPVEVAGALLCLVAIAGESLSDWQLRQFKSEESNRGKVCNVGLWRYSRHPNYFFEWLIWCGFALTALQSPGGVYALFCPAAMLLLLLFVTGVRPSEMQSVKSRGELYREYQRSTSAFIPWIPKKREPYAH